MLEKCKINTKTVNIYPSVEIFYKKYPQKKNRRHTLTGSEALWRDGGIGMYLDFSPFTLEPVHYQFSLLHLNTMFLHQRSQFL